RDGDRAGGPTAAEEEVAQLVHRDAQVLDLVEGEAHAAGDRRCRQPGQAQEAGLGRDEQPNLVFAHRPVPLVQWFPLGPPIGGRYTEPGWWGVVVERATRNELCALLCDRLRGPFLPGKL